MWQTVEDLLQNLNKVNYVFLRNNKNISEDFDENDDWDILCDNIEAFVKVCKAEAIRGSKYNYFTFVNRKRLLLDIRTVGDGYYDARWEKDILNKRKTLKNTYVIDKENDIYCTLYHALLQKNSIGILKYEQFIRKELGVYDLETNIKQLANYMRQQGYQYSVPKDLGVYINESNVTKIKEELKNG